ncbi:MAG: tRNA threonylcarbamoyladenosine dehydratase [Prevotella sp.]|nr:tRNA threonylcarbamoyladenosine dehydratase [Bacteroides sp.]MCM1367140.1 tRNA threonylcarbamoyladenosine dehydratase [Prevotella sp.]MCM1437570.1 tRNA threonylcarbamoyladenosine dehydratase [Prevotella sp.]
MGMANEWKIRTEHLLGAESIVKLRKARVLVVGVGGVGGYAAEMLCRTGVGALTLVDADNVAVSNINRQLIAGHSTVGQSKVILFAERFHNINPLAHINAVQEFVTPENIGELLEPHYDYVIDAIDTVAPKVALISHCLLNKIPIISSMGAGGRIDPTAVVYADLWETREDGLARAVRQRLKKMKLHRPLKVVASVEPPRSFSLVEVNEQNKRTSYGTVAAIPAIFGIYLAQYVIRQLIK